MSKIVLTAASRIGCIRSNNEDMVLALDTYVRSETYQTTFIPENINRFIVAVADGMGGHNAGEVASELVLSNLKFYVGDLPLGMTSEKVELAMRDWLNSIHKTVNERGRSNSTMAQMGTTLVGVLYYGNRYFWMNCGDSRLYRFREGQLTQLTTDHSLSNMLGSSQHSNVITNCIGGGCSSSFIDIVKFTDDVKLGDTYLLCTDGLTDMLPDSIIFTMLSNGTDANNLCDAAVAAGGLDNVSCCVMQF